MGIYHDQVIEAAYLHTKPGCFYIGPFARRVSFASQQFRALDLVAALVEKKRLLHPKGHSRAGRPKQIAVVGAGIAGITAAAALRGQGCKVHLYERLKEPLLVQREARHRLVHPTISRWPNQALELTTDFPFMDWFAAPCSRVIHAMQEEWEQRLAPKKGDRNFEFFPKVTVTGIIPHQGVVRLKVAPAGAGPAMVAYDYVFVTTGFGEEASVAGHQAISYWTEDEVEQWQREQREVYVSGCGDGGLIDALRLVHGDFDGGWLAIRLANMLTGWMDQEIIEAESEALMAAKSLECMKLMANDGVGEESDPLRKVGSRFEDDAITRRLTNFYRQRVVPNLPATARKMLDVSLEKGGVTVGKVTLVSRQEEPFGPNSAPIHKIMVEHALDAGRISYRRGELNDEGGLSIITMHDVREKVPVTEKINLVVRHGSPANLAGLASPQEAASLRIRQFMLADYIDTDTRRPLPPPKDYPCNDGSRLDPRYVGIRWRMAAEVMDMLLPGATVSAMPEGFVYSYPCASPGNRLPLELPIPKKLFGIPVEEAPMTSVSLL